MQHQFYSLSQILEVVGGQLAGNVVEKKVCDLLIDSRQLVAADQALFFALVSSRNDGHKYIKSLYEKGVRAFVVDHLPDESFPEATFLVVDDTLKALQTLAAFHRQQFDIPVLGITGSHGRNALRNLAGALGTGKKQENDASDHPDWYHGRHFRQDIQKWKLYDCILITIFLETNLTQIFH